MNTENQWFLLESEADYNRATARYEALKEAVKGSIAHQEKLLLVHLIAIYENQLWDLPAVDPIETIKIRMQEFGLKASDLAKEYGDKGTLSKVLNYQRALSLAMIRKFSKKLHIPTVLLVQEYTLKS